MMAGNDVLNIGSNAQTLLATSGNLINGGPGIDTLMIAAGTTLDLTALTNNQTVKSIEQVEIFSLQGTSTLTLSANDVLSLGQTNAFTTNGKVQFMINGTASDHVSLQNLLSDGVGGNASLSGMWSKDASQVTVNSVAYNVYTHSTTGAQVLVQAAIPDANVSLSASPLVIDLNGDGIQTTTQANGVQFDLNNTGSAQSVSWVEKHDGLLAIDLNGDGVINSGAELLGTSTRLADGTLAKDGWQALSQYDSNRDGRIDAQDAVFGKLKVWVDANGDGRTENGELKSLSDLNIQSISLNHTNTQTQQNGNILDGVASVQFADGSSSQMTDAWLNVSASSATSGTINPQSVSDAPSGNTVSPTAGSDTVIVDASMLSSWMSSPTSGGDLPAIPTVLPAMPTGDLPAIPDVLPAIPTGPLPAIPDVLPAIPGVMPNAPQGAFGVNASVGASDHSTAIHSLFVNGSGLELDLTQLPVASKLQGIDAIDLGDTGANSIKLDLHSILSMEGPLSQFGGVSQAGHPLLVVNGSSNDTLNLLDQANWTIESTHLSGDTLAHTLGSNFHFAANDNYTKMTQGAATLYVDEELQKVHQPLTI